MELKSILALLFLFSFLFFILFLITFFLSLFFSSGYSLYLEVLSLNRFSLDLSFVFLLDYVSLLFFSAVSLISSVVFLYRNFYMGFSFNLNLFILRRFFYILFTFVFSMFLLVFSGRWLRVMLGWDGLGLISFLLVIFYNDSVSLVSGLITIFINRIGDALFLLSFMLFYQCGWIWLDGFRGFFSFLFFFLFFLGASTKRAQFPFSSWLPAAMSAPTPVSSLVHSSTLVTAGVYLLIRFNYIFGSFLWLVSLFSLCTLLLGGICALVELDFKKVVAISTLRQLGFMIFSISMGLWELSLMHMMFHAYFKRSLFLTTGGLIHYLRGAQDSRLFGAMGSSFFSKLFFSTRCLRLVGFPFSLGFYSKDLVLGAVLLNCSFLGGFVFFLGCSLTVAYSLRLIWMGFIGYPSIGVNLSFSDDFYFFVPVILLYFFCCFSGNFFFFGFILSPRFTFFESFMGLVVLILGAFLFSFFSLNYFFIFSFRKTGFLSLLSSSSISYFFPLLPFKVDHSWSELVGGKGFILLINLLNSFYEDLLQFLLIFFLVFLFIIYFILY